MKYVCENYTSMVAARLSKLNGIELPNRIVTNIHFGKALVP